MIGCVVHYQNVTEVSNGCCRDMNWMCRLVLRMLERYVLNVQVLYQNVTEVCTGHAVHSQNVAGICFGCSGSYQNIAKTFKIKSEAVIFIQWCAAISVLVSHTRYWIILTV